MSFMSAPGTGSFHSHLCKLEKYLVSFIIFSAVKPASKGILNSAARTVVEVPQSSAFAFSYPSFYFSLLPLSMSLQCYLRFSAIIKLTAC